GVLLGTLAPGEIDIGEEGEVVVPPVARRQVLDVRRLQRPLNVGDQRLDFDAVYAACGVVTAAIRVPRFPCSGDGAHIGHRPALLRALDGHDDVRNGDGGDHADDRHY